MQIPSTIEFLNMPPSSRLAARVERRIARLRRLFGRLIDCRVAIEAPHHHHRAGNRFRVRIAITVPGSELVVSREPGLDPTHADAGVAIRDAFDAAERRLTEYRRQRGGDGAQHRRARASRNIGLPAEVASAMPH